MPRGSTTLDHMLSIRQTCDVGVERKSKASLWQFWNCKRVNEICVLRKKNCVIANRNREQTCLQQRFSGINSRYQMISLPVIWIWGKVLSILKNFSSKYLKCLGQMKQNGLLKTLGYSKSKRYCDVLLLSNTTASIVGCSQLTVLVIYISIRRFPKKCYGYLRPVNRCSEELY